MNSNSSPTLNIADSQRTPLHAAGANSDMLPGARAGDSFNALYDNESTSFKHSSQNKNNNINKLDGERTREDSAGMEAEQLISRDNMDATPANTDQPSKDEEQIFDTVLLHGISVAMPSNNLQTKVGEKLPQGGKELPPVDELPPQESLQLSTGEETEIGDLLTKHDAEIGNRGRNSIGSRDNRLGTDGANALEFNSTRSDFSIHEYRIETTQSRQLMETPVLNSSQSAALPVQDSTTALMATNNSSVGMTAVTSQTESGAVQKLGMATELAPTADLSTSSRTNFDRSTALGEKIHWMRNANISTAELHLHPAELGSIEIKIITEDQQARVSFITSSSAARDVIEESLPKLRDLLADSGLALDQSDISQKESGGESNRNEQQISASKAPVERELEHEFTAPSLSPRIGQVDHYV